MKKQIIAVLILVMSLLCLHCDILCDDCSREMDDTRDKYGEPEEINSYDASDYHSVDWWYWSQGVEFTFAWGEIVDGCEVSKYTFTPIE